MDVVVVLLLTGVKLAAAMSMAVGEVVLVVVAIVEMTVVVAVGMYDVLVVAVEVVVAAIIDGGGAALNVLGLSFHQLLGRHGPQQALDFLSFPVRLAVLK